MMDTGPLLVDLRAALTKVRAYSGTPTPAPDPVPPPAGQAPMPTIELSFKRTGRLPWACGQPFMRGAVPAGSGVLADCAEFQFDPWSFYDDGSVRDAHISGYVDVPNASPVLVTMRLGTAPARPNYVQPSPADVQVEIDGVVPAITARRPVTWGAVMTHEQVVCRIDQQLAIVYEVRHFRGGEKEVLFQTAENCAFMVASGNRRVQAVARVGGAARFAEAVDLKHHTRIPLLRGNTWTTWLGMPAQPGFRPQHNRAYLCACESFPPYAPVAATLPNVPQTYAPNYVGQNGPGMADTGYKERIGVLALHNIYPLTTGGQAAWDYMWTEALAVGSWSVHMRDETTGEPPRPASYPTHSWQTNIPNGSGGENGAADRAHQPSSVYTAAKLTGWKWFIDEHLDWVIHNHFFQQPPVRQNEAGILRTDAGTNQDRGAAWTLRSLAQGIALLPSTHALQPELTRIWRANMAFYQARVATAPYANNLGVVAPYSSSGKSLYAGGDRGVSTAWWGSGWMQAFFTAAIGHALQLRLPVGASVQADTNAVFQFSAKWVVGLCGPTHWRRFGVYAAPWWADGNQSTPGTWYTSHAQMWAEYERGHGLTTLDPAPGGTIKQHASNVDITGADWQTGRVAFYWPALVYAVMHGAPGAADAFARIRSSASWPSIAAGIQNPIWTGMMPPGVRHP